MHVRCRRAVLPCQAFLEKLSLHAWQVIIIAAGIWPFLNEFIFFS